jgi:hypothetical protein
MTKKKTTKEFIRDAIAKHGDKYDYSKSIYNGSIKKVIIICRKDGHGEFEQVASSHLRGYGCPKCGIIKTTYINKKTTEEFINDAIAKHGSCYDYSKVKYNGNKKKVAIICKIHGEFKQEAGSHLRGAGCSKCSGYYTPTIIEFIEKSTKVHGIKYNYSNVEYKNAHTPVIIICSTHGEFNQKPNCHLSGQGCYKCGKISMSNTTLNFNKHHLSIY